MSLSSLVFSLGVGALGEVLDLRLCVPLCGAVACLVCWLTVWRRRAQVREIYNRAAPAEGSAST